MPAFDKFAYTDGRCNGLTAADMKKAGGLPDPAAALQPREIESVVDFLFEKVIGKGPMDHATCVEYWGAEVLVDLRLIQELQGSAAPVIRDGRLYVTAGTTYGDFISLLETAIPELYPDPQDARRDTSHLAALLLMARRTAGRIVRRHQY